MDIRQIAASVARSKELSSHPGLPFQKNHLHIRIFCRGNSGRHTGCTAANDSDNHRLLLSKIFIYYTAKPVNTQEKLPCIRKILCYNT